MIFTFIFMFYIYMFYNKRKLRLIKLLKFFSAFLHIEFLSYFLLFTLSSLLLCPVTFFSCLFFHLLVFSPVLFLTSCLLSSAPSHFPSYSPDSLPPAVAPDYDDYSPAGGSRSSFRGRTPATYGLPDQPYRRPEYR